MVAEQGVQVKKLPDDVLVAMGNAAGEVMNEFLENDDALVRQITQSFLDYRDLMRSYQPYSDAAQFQARQLDYTFPG